MIRFNEWSEIKELSKETGINISKFDPKELKTGIEHEKEHDGEQGKDVDVVRKKGDLLKIVVAHLREDPKYYSKLREIE